MINRINWPIWVLIACLFLLFTLTFGKLVTAIQHFNGDKTVDVTNEKEEFDEQISVNTETKEGKFFTSAIDYPITKSKKIDQTINDWLEQQEKSFQDELEKVQEQLGEGTQAHLSIQASILKLKEKQYHITFRTKHMMEDENEYEQIQMYHINLETDAFFNLADIINEKVLEDDLLINEVLNGIEDASLVDEAKLREKIIDYSNLKWTAQNDHLQLYFNPGEIGTNAEVYVIEVPLKNIYDFIQKGYKKALVSEQVREEIAQSKQQSRKLDGSGKYIALTFDDGPSEDVTPRILEALNEYDAKATFFMMGKNAKQNPEIARQVADAGHEIANHSETHPNLGVMGKGPVVNEITVADDHILEASGKFPILFRPPYGEFNSYVVEQTVASNQPIIMWSVDTLDWKSRNASSVFQIATTARHGSIVLMHDIHPTTADALPNILKHFADEGFQFVTVSELLPFIEQRSENVYYGN